jgi:creatinine amidohydrolase
MKIFARGITMAGVLVLTQLTQTAQAQQPGDPTYRVDVGTMPRPIEMHDTVWIGEMTTLEVRDQIKAGKTTALVLGGGMEENGPYLSLDKHNLVSRAMGDSIARRLGNALCAPILTVEPGNPDKPVAAGGIVLTPETYKAVLTDMTTSLRAMGFKNIIFVGDHGGDMKPMEEVSKALNLKWKGDGATVYFVEKMGNGSFTGRTDSGCCGWGVVDNYEEQAFGIHEKNEGFHDEYSISAISMLIEPNATRLKERMKVKKTTINGIDLLPVPKTLANAKKLVAYRTDLVVKEIQRMMESN